MSVFSKIKEFFAWNRVQAFLKALFKGLLLILLDSLKDIAIEAAKEVASKGLPTDEAKRVEFARIMTIKATAEGYELKDSTIALLRELAVNYLKNQ